MIRAVKYAAMTGFSIPLNVKMKITAQSNLLSSISPSRLTEEIFKFIYSNKAADIVDLLDKMGLYSYLQPNASKLMKKDSVFRQRYLKTMSKLNGRESYRGQALGALFTDYLETLHEWKSGTSIENFREVYKDARSFVLPMNPPRYDMEYAVKKFLTNHGVSIKRPVLATVEGKPAPKKKRRRKPRPRKEVSSESK